MEFTAAGIYKALISSNLSIRWEIEYAHVHEKSFAPS